MTCDWSPSSRYLVIAENNCIVYDYEKKEIVAKYDCLRCSITDVSDQSHYYYYSNSIRLVMFSPNPAVNLMVMAQQTGAVRFVDTTTWHEQVFNFEGDSTGLDFSEDGKTIYVSTTEEIMVFEWRSDMTLVELCVRFIRRNSDDRKWNLDCLPLELKEKLQGVSSS